MKETWNILVATSAAPKTEDNFKQVCSIIREACASEGTIVGGILWTYGPHCTNLAIEVTDTPEQLDRFGDFIARALGPMSKWCTTADKVPAGDNCEIKFNEVV